MSPELGEAQARLAPRPSAPGSAVIFKLSLAGRPATTLRARVAAKKQPKLLAFLLKVTGRDFVLLSTNGTGPVCG